MVLRRDHIAAWRVNWRPKSENIQSLARELGIGLDSFIFIDDDPLECTKVRQECPEILTLQLPPNTESIPRFLKHVWALDHRKITEEDKQRTTLYRQHLSREHVRRDSLTLRDFLTSLNLEVSVSPLSPADITRVSELTYRTNQFNLTTTRRTEAEIRRFCERKGTECLVVKVRDRFGDYGLVGTVIFEADAESLVVDTFLLSCRALGRNVEHTMLAKLAEIAKRRGLSQVKLPCIPSGKNTPALDFLKGLSKGVREPLANGFVIRISIEDAVSASYGRDDGTAHSPSPGAEANFQSSVTTLSGNSGVRTALLSSIPEALYDPQIIHQRISRNRVRAVSDTSLVPPRTSIEKTLVDIYSDLLGIEEIGIHDSFFELGGHSLLAMQVLSRVREAFQMDLSITLFFTTNFTAAELADAVLSEQVKQSDPEKTILALKGLLNLTEDEAETILGDPSARSKAPEAT
jgi:FkbH-like protein